MGVWDVAAGVVVTVELGRVCGKDGTAGWGEGVGVGVGDTVAGTLVVMAAVGRVRGMGGTTGEGVGAEDAVAGALVGAAAAGMGARGSGAKDVDGDGVTAAEACRVVVVGLGLDAGRVALTMTCLGGVRASLASRDVREAASLAGRSSGMMIWISSAAGWRSF